MKKISGLMMILAAAAALAAPAMARDRDDCGYGAAVYNNYQSRPVYTAHRDVRDRHEVRRDVRPVRSDRDRR